MATATAACTNCGRDVVIVVDLGDVEDQLAAIKRDLRTVLNKENKIMASQDDIDAATAAIGTAVADLGTQNTAIQTAQAALDTEIQTLVAELAAGNPVDTTALVAASAALATATGGLDSTVAALTADPNVPAPPAPPAAQ